VKPVFSYIDFREYLRDYYLENKKTKGFTFREFSRRAGFTSPSFIKLVIESKANLRKSSIAKLCTAMGLKREERRYFKSLVLFGQAKDLKTKMRFLEALRQIGEKPVANQLTAGQFEYFSQWYHPVIRELLDLGIGDDSSTLAKTVIPPLSEEEARESVELLLRLNLIIAEGDRYRAAHRFLTTEGSATDALAVHCVQKKMAQLASDALDIYKKEERDISGLTVALSNRSFELVQTEFAALRRKIMEIASEEKEADKVYRCNFHIFPLSTSVKVNTPRNEEGEEK
jgi:uncharacterized protein (TIGR02147 family)